jgi:hypothetical protein
MDREPWGDETAEAWTHEPPPAPEYVVRTLPLCPVCKGLARRELAEAGQHGPWRCDLHGEVTPEFEELEVPA